MTQPSEERRDSKRLWGIIPTWARLGDFRQTTSGWFTSSDATRLTRGGEFFALKQSDYYFHIFSRARIKLMVSALARCGVASARLCSVRDCGDWPAEKERVFSVWSLAWEQSESGHHTTLWQPRGRQWRQHTPPRPCPAPDTCPFHADLLAHSHTDSPYACEYGHAHRRCPLKQIAISTKH